MSTLTVEPEQVTDSTLMSPPEPTVMSPFAQTIFEKKYAWKDENGDPTETWAETAHRVTTHVLGALGYQQEDREFEAIEALIRERKFIPGGRYLYASGRDLHQTQNCFAGETRFLTDKGAKSLEEMTGTQVRIRNRNGDWEDAEVHSFGEQELMKVTLTNGDVLYATEGHRWWMENDERVTTAELEHIPFGRAVVDPELDAEGVRHGIIFGDGHLVKDRYSQIVFVNPAKDESLVDWFDDEERSVVVGFGATIKVQTIRSTKRGTVISLQPRHYKSLPLTYTPEYARGFIAGLIATDGCVPEGGSVQIHCEGLNKAHSIAEIAVAANCVVNSVRVVSRVSPFTGEPRELACISIKPFSAPVILPSHKENVDKRRLRHNFRMSLGVESVEVCDRVEPVYCVVAPESESFTLANGLITSNCLLMKATDSREGWADLLKNAAMALQTGAGIGIDYSEVRPSGSPIKRTGGEASGPLALMQMVNEIGRGVMQGGSRRSAIWAGLNWSHGDVEKFIRCKDWPDALRTIKKTDFNFPAPMEFTNISILLDDEFFEAYERRSHPKHTLAQQIYDLTVRRMVKTAEPGLSVDVGQNAGESLRNACTEVTSDTDSDICNLGSLNLARFEDKEDFAAAVRYATLFLLAGTVYSHVPYPEVAQVRHEKRRLGLGVMGVHEWLLQRGHRYGPNDDLALWLDEYSKSTEMAAEWADQHGLTHPIKTRAIAPTGTIGIIAETTTGIEPIFCVAYKRRYLDGQDWKYQYVVDPTARKVIEQYSIDPSAVEDAYSLAYDVERRVAFQAWVQQWVDHGISSTINLPYPITDDREREDFADMLYDYLPSLRGVTCYPDGARGGQPLTAVSYEEAVRQEGVVFEEDPTNACSSGVCGI